jgi:hypothetical protein
MKYPHRKLKILAGIVLLSMVAMACHLPGGKSTVTAVPQQGQPTTVSTQAQQEPTQAPVPTDAPTQTVVPPTDTPAPDVSFEGVSFSAIKPFSSGATGLIVAANPPTQDGPYWGVEPRHVELLFQDYALADTFHKPQVIVYPVKEFMGMSEEATKVINNLMALVQQQPATPSRLPFLPMWNAGPALETNIQYLSFQNGKGVRYLTFYTQSFAVINNHELFYTFQGLTDDGNHYVSVILPVSSPILPADGNQIPGGDQDAFANNYKTYIDDVTQKLNAQPNESFTPNLAQLDAMVETLLVK